MLALQDLLVQIFCELIIAPTLKYAVIVNKAFPMNTYEPRREKTGFLHMRKQRRRSASR